jgi:hypothetical protein
MRNPKKQVSKEKEWPFGVALGLRQDEGWVDAFKQEIARCAPELRARWEELLTLAKNARPRVAGEWPAVEDESESQCGYPRGEYDGRDVVPEPGTDSYHEALARTAPDELWLQRVRDVAKNAADGHFHSTLAHIYRSATQSGIGSLNRKAPNREVLRALIWCVAAVADADMIDALRQLAIWSLAHNTAQANTIGIALAFTASEQAAAALRSIETASKRPSQRTRFGRFASHVERKIGISPEDSAERFVPTYGLDSHGVLRAECGEHGAIELRMDGSTAAIAFYNSSGKQVAAAPAAIRRDHPRQVQEMRVAAKGLAQLLGIQRDRIEAILVSPRTWDLAAWSARYLNHPVVATVARRLIWTFDETAAVFVNGNAIDVDGNAVAVSASAKVRLWHPLGRAQNEVRAWRNRLELLGVTQPFKQAYRELYLLTEAERQTATYSNRFAGHILRQTQFRALARVRQWEAPLLGDWDGSHNAATRDLPDGWRVEFWVDPCGDEHGTSWGLIYVSTDQVRFYHGTDREPAPLEQVPALIFSEALRDADLFVGITSVGNDPRWSDGGPDGRYRNYWERCSFGELSASGQTRKDVIERLIPKLKIADRCSLNERFLVVRGDLRTYKIHLGSGNILMEPNDQYLCIVPARSATNNAREKFLLPFEGDSTLSVILSKAFLLADDAKIRDPSIVSQIRT